MPCTRADVARATDGLLPPTTKIESKPENLPSLLGVAHGAHRQCTDRPNARNSRCGERRVSVDWHRGFVRTPNGEENRAAGESALPLVIGVSTRALFDCEDEHRVFAQDGEAAYCALLRERETNPLHPGCAFEFIKRLLALNAACGAKLVDVVLLSRNAPDQALRIFNACEANSLAIVAGSFTGGRPIAPYAEAWGVDLFLSKDDEDVRAALGAGIAAARLAPTPKQSAPTRQDEVHFALDGDAVTFGAESEGIFRKAGLSAFERHERLNAHLPLAPGPLGGPLLRKFLALRSLSKDVNGQNRIRISMVTAREAPAHERVLVTLRHWRVLLDEIHFVGYRSKVPFLAAAGALIFFDDRATHVDAASHVVAAGQVPADGDLPQSQLSGT